MTKSINVSPTLIIGLGGTGSLALQHVKQKIRKRLEEYEGGKLPIQIPFLEYLTLDTTSQEEKIEEFIPDEFLNIGRLNVSRVISNLELEADDRILKWFPKHLDPGQIDSGAGGVRAIGRLCFFLNQSEIESRIRNKVRKITDSTNTQNFLSEHLNRLKIEEASTIDVHIVSSLCGGTGSACLLDTAYLVRHLISDITKQMPNSTAHLVTCEAFEGEPGVGHSSREYIQYNFAVSLSEIEHFTKKNAPSPWDVEYRNGTTVHSAEKPFGVTYLLGYKEGVSLGKRQLCEIIGETIALKTVHPDGRFIKGLIENYKPHVINTEDDKQKRRTYSSYNAQILNIGVHDSSFERAVSSGAKKIMVSLSQGVEPGIGEFAFKEFEQMVFAVATKMDKLEFSAAEHLIKSEVGISPDNFSMAFSVIRNDLHLPPKKLAKEAPTLLGRVKMACDQSEAEIELNQRRFAVSLRTAFKELETKTDDYINSQLGEHSLMYVHALLKHICQLLAEFKVELAEYRKSLPSVELNYDEEIVKAISAGRGEKVPEICAKRSQARNYAAIYETLSQVIKNYMVRTENLKDSCRTASECLLEANAKLPEEKGSTRSSQTTSFVWNEAALNRLIEESRVRVIRKFVSLLEQYYYADGISQKTCFLPHLNTKSLNAINEVQDIAKKATELQLQLEMVSNEETMRQRALESIHEFVELASPAWQIERSGEDVAAVSVTNCPEDSESGQILARYGKNITFSQNGADPRELVNGAHQREVVLFRSEHGASVYQLINFRRSLNAVSRKLYLEGKNRINDLCLDPAWDIAAPLPLELDKLRLDFTLAIFFNLITPGTAYTFKNKIDAVVELRQNRDEKKATRRFEAFGKLLDLECEGSQDCRYLRETIRTFCRNNSENEHIHLFVKQLEAHRDKLDKLLKDEDERDVREQMQITREIESLNGYLEELYISVKAIELNRNDK